VLGLMPCHRVVVQSFGALPQLLPVVVVAQARFWSMGAVSMLAAMAGLTWALSGPDLGR
jgi:hypothetical protein